MHGSDRRGYEAAVLELLPLLKSDTEGWMDGEGEGEGDEQMRVAMKRKQHKHKLTRMEREGRGGGEDKHSGV